jgi:hypothetical protein
MTDVDMRNCHPTIIYNLCKLHGFKCLYLEEYVKNRKQLIAEKKCTKTDIIRSINKRQNLKCDGWLKLFDMEMKQIQKYFYALPEYEQQKSLSESNPRNREGAFMSHLATSFEAKIMDSVRQSVKVEVAVDMFDGFMFYGERPDNFLQTLHDMVKEKHNMDIEWDYKEHDNTLVVPDDWMDDNPDLIYAQMKHKYENDYKLAFIEKNVMYSLKIGHNELCFFSQNELKQHFANVIIKRKGSFIEEWFLDPERQSYHNVGVYPHDSICPDGILNLWNGYSAESLPESDADISLFLNHLKILTKEKNVYEFLLDWFANMLQFPSEKSIMFVLQGEEGTGKSAVCDFINLIVGNECSIEINDVKERLFCRFNAHLSKKIFVNINETSRAEMLPFTEKLKAFITSKDIAIEEKGKGVRHEQQLMHFMTTLNPDNSFKITEKSRRFAYVECSNELLGDTEYFTKLFEFIYKPENQRAFYQFLMSRKVKHCITLKDIPITEDMKRQFVLNREPIEDYCEQFQGQKSADDNYNDYKAFLVNSGLKYEVPKKLFEMRFNKIMGTYNIEKNRPSVDGVRNTVYFKPEPPPKN